MQRIQQAICYMEEHILDDISYVDVARSVRMSGYSFHRTFRFVTGITPTEYIRCRRLALAGQELQTTGISVIDAAMKYGYESPESFSKAFSKFHGSSPRQAKQKGASLRLFNPFIIKITIGGGSVMDYRIEHREGQRFLALTRDFSNEESLDTSGRSIPDFWAECREKGLVEPMLELCPPGRRDLYGLCSPLRDSETQFTYGIGVAAGAETEVEKLTGQGYTLWQTGPADYAVFSCFGPDGECLGETWDKFFKEFLPQTGYAQTDDTDYEVYFEEPKSGLFCELWVPVKKG